MDAEHQKDTQAIAAVAAEERKHHHTPLFIPVPHPQIARRKKQGPVKLKDQLDRGSPIARLNTRLAVVITLAVGSMWAAYLFALLAFVSFPSAIGSHNTIII